MTFAPTLRALCAEATKGPWTALKHTEIGGEWPGSWFFYGMIDGQHGVRFMYADGDQFDTLSESDASLIVFLANRAEAIAELAEAAGRVSVAFRNQDQDSPEAPLHALRAALAKLEVGA